MVCCHGKGVVHQRKEGFIVRKKETKFSINMTLPDGTLANSSHLASAQQGCLMTLERLGRLAEVVEAFRVVWISLEENRAPGLQFTVYFHDPLGSVTSYTTDYSFIGEMGRHNPWADEIARALCSKLPGLISQHIKCCQKRLETASADCSGFVVTSGDLSRTLKKQGHDEQ
jgi:hypothetical protein